MRILFVAPNISLPGTNGGSTHVTEVVRALRRKHEVHVLARWFRPDKLRHWPKPSSSSPPILHCTSGSVRRAMRSSNANIPGKPTASILGASLKRSSTSVAATKAEAVADTPLFRDKYYTLFMHGDSRRVAQNPL